MNDKKIDKFIDSLTRPEDAQNTEINSKLNKEEVDLMSLWNNLGKIPLEDMNNSRNISRFQEHLDAYKQGWQSGQCANKSIRLSHLIKYGIAACIAIGLFFSGILVNQSTQPNDNLQRELASTRETLTLALLNQNSAPQRVAGLTNATQIHSPSIELKEAILWALDHDDNLNVRLAAIETLCTLTPQEVTGLLIQRLDSQDSPLVQIEIIRVAQRLGNATQQEIIQATLTKLPLKPSIKRHLEIKNQSI